MNRTRKQPAAVGIHLRRLLGKTRSFFSGRPHQCFFIKIVFFLIAHKKCSERKGIKTEEDRNSDMNDEDCDAETEEE